MDAPMKKAVRSSRAKPKVLLIIIIVAALIALGIVFIKKNSNPSASVESQHAAVLNQIGNDSVQGSLTDKQKTDILKQLSKKTPAPNMTDRAAILDSIGKTSNQ